MAIAAALMTNTDCSSYSSQKFQIIMSLPSCCDIPRPFDFGPPPDEIDGPAEFLDRFDFDHLDRCGIDP